MKKHIPYISINYVLSVFFGDFILQQMNIMKDRLQNLYLFYALLNMIKLGELGEYPLLCSHSRILIMDSL